MRSCINNVLILWVDYTEKVTRMKPTKSCLRHRTVTVMTKWQQYNFRLLDSYTIIKQPWFNGKLELLLHRIK